jgi:hypothetical protein
VVSRDAVITVVALVAGVLLVLLIVRTIGVPSF